MFQVDDAVLRVSLPYKEYHLFAEVIKVDKFKHSNSDRLNDSLVLTKVKSDKPPVGEL